MILISRFKAIKMLQVRVPGSGLVQIWTVYVVPLFVVVNSTEVIFSYCGHMLYCCLYIYNSRKHIQFVNSGCRPQNLKVCSSISCDSTTTNKQEQEHQQQQQQPRVVAAAAAAAAATASTTQARTRTTRQKARALDYTDHTARR